MPLYEYECTVCHQHTEKIQKFSDPEITACPFCSGELKRVISAPAFALKGGGWYADGYGSAKPAPASGDAPAAAVEGSAPTAAPTPAASPAPAPAATPAPATAPQK